MEMYSRKELRVLWYLKRNGPMVLGKKTGNYSLIGKLSAATGVSSMRYILDRLEARSLVLRTYEGGKKGSFSGGTTPVIRIELVDPNMGLPPLPQNPPAVVIVHENEELYERTAEEPDTEAMMHALIDRITEIQSQCDKLQQIIVEQEVEIEKLRKQVQPRRPSQGLTQRVQGVLTAEQWEKLRHHGQ
jgi:hypothetical protein